MVSDMEVAVREARVADIPQMCSLLSELFSIEADFSPDREKQFRGLELLLSRTSGLSVVLVGEANNTIVGMCSLQIMISTAEGGPVGLMEDLVVQKDLRGRRIGTRLLTEISRWCRAQNISRIQLLRDADNPAAERFYLSDGWSGTNLVCMRKFP
ncbi:MAG: GNAT family N-acetyltransferase [Thermodesulfovibrio sp.]|nr:GNAT family N-acetyltransferase [Thermodesulfovibrio sp.]